MLLERYLGPLTSLVATPSPCHRELAASSAFGRGRPFTMAGSKITWPFATEIFMLAA